MKPRKERREVTVTTYTNRKGESRVSVLFSRDFALRISVGDEDALAHIQRAVLKRIEDEERGE